jgi:hypothetical protein
MHVKWQRRGGFQFTVRSGLAPPERWVNEVFRHTLEKFLSGITFGGVPRDMGGSLRKVFPALLFSAILFCQTTRAEQIQLKDGTKVTGKLVGVTGDTRPPTVRFKCPALT